MQYVILQYKTRLLVVILSKEITQSLKLLHTTMREVFICVHLSESRLLETSGCLPLTDPL